MPRFFTLLLIGFSLFLTANANAADLTVLPFPKNFLDFKPENYEEALQQVKHITAPHAVNVTLHDWSKLEPTAGTYRVQEEMGGALHAIELGYTPYIGATVIDTTNLARPDDLKRTKWNDPLLLQRYEALLDTLATKFPRTVPYFVIGNEVDVYLDKHRDELAGFQQFLLAAMHAVRQRFPQAQIGVSVTYEGYLSDRKDIISLMIAASDTAFFTFYPQVAMKFFPPDETPAQLDILISAAQNKPVLLQEVGYPSGSKTSSEAIQAEFFRVIIPAIQARQQIKLASLFALHDFEPKLCDMLAGYYGVSGIMSLMPWVTEFKAFLCTLGLKTSDGQPKQAWNVVMESLAHNR
jgi:hypothetical protein